MRNPYLKSLKYDELINMYSLIAKNGCYTSSGKFIPPDQVFGRSSQLKFKDILKELFVKHNISTLIDYGSGQGDWNVIIENNITLKKFLNLKEIHQFEPARDKNKKILSECIVSLDVLEHVFISDVPWVLFDIFANASKLVIINVACYPASKVLPNNENVHITERHPLWWKGMIDNIGNFFPKIKYVILASTSYKNVEIFHEVSSEEFINSSGYTAIKK